MPFLRLFIALETPRSIIPQIAAIRDSLKASNADVRWEIDEKLHATIKFLGKTDEGLLPEIVSYIRGVCETKTPLSVVYRQVGCFPNRKAPRVVWVGMEDTNGPIVSLKKEIESVLAPLGFEKEEREFHPHVTLGRVKSERGVKSLLRMMESVTFESQPVEIREVSLVRSDLKPDGSVYTILKRIPLGK
jgi:2'-5' RNA ligase